MRKVCTVVDVGSVVHGGLGANTSRGGARFARGTWAVAVAVAGRLLPALWALSFCAEKPAPLRLLLFSTLHAFIRLIKSQLFISSLARLLLYSLFLVAELLVASFEF